MHSRTNGVVVHAHAGQVAQGQVVVVSDVVVGGAEVVDVVVDVVVGTAVVEVDAGVLEKAVGHSVKQREHSCESSKPMRNTKASGKRQESITISADPKPVS